MSRSDATSGRNWTRGSASLRRDLLPQVQLELALTSRAPAKTPGRDPQLEAIASDLLTANGASALAAKIRVEGSSRLRSAAGRAEFVAMRVVLNCRLGEHGEEEVDRTLRHELAHLL